MAAFLPDESLKQNSASGSLVSATSLSTPPVSLLQMTGYIIYIFKKDVDKQFIRKICTLRWPMQADCGCRSCVGCLYNFNIGDREGELQCPSCEETFNTSEITRDHYSRKQVEKMRVSQGCTAVVIRGRLADHLQKKCQYRSAACEYCGDDFAIIDMTKMAAKHSDKIDALEENVGKAANKEDVIEMKKTFFKPLQEKQDQMDDRLKRVERGAVGPGRARGGVANEALQGSASSAGAVSNARMVSVENQMGMHAVCIAEHDIRFQVLDTANYEGVLVWKIKDFTRRKRDADSGKTLSLYSQPFFSSRYGYKMCARIYLNGDGMGKGTHLSLFFVVMRGDFDALLPWPFSPNISANTREVLPLSDSFRPDPGGPDPKTSSSQRPTNMNIASGCPLFVNQNVLKDSAYVKDDVVFIKVIVDTSDLYGPGLTAMMYIEVAYFLAEACLVRSTDSSATMIQPDVATAPQGYGTQRS